MNEWMGGWQMNKILARGGTKSAQERMSDKPSDRAISIYIHSLIMVLFLSVVSTSACFL